MTKAIGAKYILQIQGEGSLHSHATKCWFRLIIGGNMQYSEQTGDWPSFDGFTKSRRPGKKEEDANTVTSMSPRDCGGHPCIYSLGAGHAELNGGPGHRRNATKEFFLLTYKFIIIYFCNNSHYFKYDIS